jgi:hypothetical protein
VIPGVAAVEILTSADDIREVRIVPLPMTGPGAQFAPVSDLATPSSDNPRLYTGQLWMMSAGPGRYGSPWTAVAEWESCPYRFRRCRRQRST